MTATWGLFSFQTCHIHVRVFGVCVTISIVRSHVRLKTRLRRLYFGFINLINRPYFHLNALQPGIYRFSGSASLLASNCPFSCATQTEAISAILILSLIFYYWHRVMEAVVSDLWTCWPNMFINLTQLLPLLCANNRKSMIKSRWPI